MSGNKNIILPPETGQSELSDDNIVLPTSEVSIAVEGYQTSKIQPKVSSSSERQIKFERAQKCLENAALVSKRIKEHRKATAELLGKPFDDDDGGDNASELASTMSERTGYSAATESSTTLSVQEALNIPGISESLANTLKQKELLMERIKQYKEISKRPMNITSRPKKDSSIEKSANVIKGADTGNVTQLISTIKDKENALSIMQVKMKAMETTILDLQEKISEKDQIIEAKNKATTIISDSLSKKERDTLVLLEDTRQQMMKMQENFASMEAEWKDERQKLVQQLEIKEEKISNLEEANTVLENAKSEISMARDKLIEEIELKEKKINELEEEIQKLIKVQHSTIIETKLEREELEKGAQEIANMEELTKKIDLLEQINCQIRQTNIELENKLATINTESKSTTTSSPSKKGTSPLPTRKGGRNTASKMKSPWTNLSAESLQEAEKKPNKSEITKLEMLVQSLNKDILEKEYTISQKDLLIGNLQNLNEEKDETIKTLQAKSPEVPSVDTLDAGVNTELETKTSEEFKLDSELPTSLDELKEKLKSALEQIASLNSEIEASNKNMIKVKSSTKLKLKQLQKTIDNFSKVSDSNAEIIKLNEEIHQLSQKVAELEEEKGNLQLHLVDYDSGRLTDSDIYKKMIEMESLAESRLKAISVLETQKFDLVQELHVLQQKNYEMEDKLADMTQLQSDQVCSEIKSVQLEEQIDQLTASKKELENTIGKLNNDKEHLNAIIKSLEEEKDELVHKLESYLQENMELTDKLEKMSAEKVSSAESIEIVESLTTQEKLELEEYNKGMIDNKIVDQQEEYPSLEHNMENIVEQSAELNKKIELFTQERQEVLEKMNMISEENKVLQIKILELNNDCDALRHNIELLNKEKFELQNLNQEVTKQVEELKRERLDIMKESVEIPKPSSLEDAGEVVATELHQDDKSTADKGNSRGKSVKQLTKEILKLKNTIKEREAEIADCQMKILSLEEYQQKQNELLRSNATYENKVKSLTEENAQLRLEIDSLKVDPHNEQDFLKAKQENEFMQQELQKINQEYNIAINARDAKIYELENLLKEYETQIMNYGNSLQQKDKEITEYINQVTKLNDVSQKLKSTIELLEEEKLKDQNAELVKSLNKQVIAYQNKLTEYEEKINIYEEEKTQLVSIKNTLEAKQQDIETELTKMQELLTERQNAIKELKSIHQKQVEDMMVVMEQVKERDEEIHEVKLQLRKESIENEKLRNSLVEKEAKYEELTKEIRELKENYNEKSSNSDEIIHEITELKSKLNIALNEKNELNEKYEIVENKNKEFLDKLKKFAFNIKKKTAMYTELENLYNESQKQLECRNEQLEQYTIQVATLPAIEEKLKYAEEEIKNLRTQKIEVEKVLHQQIDYIQNEFSKATDTVNLLQKELLHANENKISLKTQIEVLDNKLAEYEIEQKNSMNLTTKLASLEADINHKQQYIVELKNLVENYQQQLHQVQFGHEAKVQERDLYIENLETEINKYRQRIIRLEESISVMEDRRHSLERKADQLDNQLQEKQKAYSEYTSQEDELVNRLAALIDHDRVVDKQLNEIESENKELHYKIQYLNDENHRVTSQLSEIQSRCNSLMEKASRAESAESELNHYLSQVKDLEAQLKRVTNEHQLLLMEKRKEIEDIESEFSVQIKNAIKEKKTLSEKYEKLTEHVKQLEEKLQDYGVNIDNLNFNIVELNRVNEELRSNQNNDRVATRDYTEQYIDEINRLNATVNVKVQEASELNNTIQSMQINNNAVISKLQHEILEHKSEIQNHLDEINKLKKHIEAIENNNSLLEKKVLEKDDQIKQLSQNKTLMFEMNIPKTEGMFISSTIEPVEEHKSLDVSDLESQIVSNIPQPKVIQPAFVAESYQTQAKKPIEAVVEPEIIPKKAYQCFKGQEQENEEADPFNSDEGWGLGDSDETTVVMPGFSHFQTQIDKLKVENDELKASLNSTTLKLQKAIKKLKELKANNDVLTNELKLSKQLLQTSSLDFAIEDELTKNIQELEKKVADVSNELNKEKREKDALRKQNEVFNNANETLTEMKEKLDNEVELWKYKFKEVNDKLSSYQWSSSADSPQHKVASPADPNSASNIVQFKEEISKLEQENDELHSLNDNLKGKYEEIVKQQTELKNIINDLENKLAVSQNRDEFKESFSELLSSNQELQEKNEVLRNKVEEETALRQEIELARNEIQNISESSHKLKDDKINELLNALSESENLKLQAQNNVTVLTEELEGIKSKLTSMEQLNLDTDKVELNILTEKNRILEEQCEMLKMQLEQSQEKIFDLSGIVSENQELLRQLKFSEEEIYKLKTDLINLHSELNKSTQVLEQDTGENTSQLKLQLQEANKQVQKLELENTELLEKVRLCEDTISELNKKLNNLNSENDNLLSTVTELRSSLTSAVDQRGFEIAELWKQHLAQREANFQKIEQELRTELSLSETKYEQLLESVQSSTQEETNKLIMMEQLNLLQSKLQDREDQIQNVQEKYSEVIGQLELMRSELDDEKVMYENKLVAQQEEYEKVIKDLSTETESQAETYQQKYDNLQSELKASKTENEDLNRQIEDLVMTLKDSEEKILELTNELRLKDAELQRKTHDVTIVLNQRNEEFENVRAQLLEYEKKIEDLSFEKESELAIMRLKIHEDSESYENQRKELYNEKESLAQALNAKIVECTTLNKQIVELNKSLEEDATRGAEMQSALENQELEIVTLKDEVASLQNMLQATSSRIEKHVSFASGTKLASEADIEEELNKELLDAVPRAELDLALYMLHQRDVRCEELTMELTQLLEERDTLQLRLSDSLRSYEELKSKCMLAGLDTSLDTSQETISELPSFSVEREFVDVHRGQTSRSSSISDVDPDKPKLQAKLSELRTVRQNRDITLRQDSESRQLGMRLLQRDVANLPPEAVERLSQAHHTLSRDSQSTSTVLLNWLRGKSTPKVVHQL